VQNPNETAIDYNGVALDLEVNGRPWPRGQRSARLDPALFGNRGQRAGQRFAFSVLRQTLGLSQTQTLDNLPYVLRGKLAGGCSAPCVLSTVAS
jgi:hypothetical protein